MDDMRNYLDTGREPGASWVEYKCRVCGFQSVCWRRNC
jgi:CRISPR/Cas system-associated exonuclease Cas4 (RecB family)